MTSQKAYPETTLVFHLSHWPWCPWWTSCPYENADGEKEIYYAVGEGKQQRRPSDSLPAGWALWPTVRKWQRVSVSSRAQGTMTGSGHYPWSWPGRTYLSNWLERSKINSWWVLLWHPGALVTELINQDTNVKIKVSRKSQLVIE